MCAAVADVAVVKLMTLSPLCLFHLSELISVISLEREDWICVKTVKTLNPPTTMPISKQLSSLPRKQDVQMQSMNQLYIIYLISGPNMQFDNSDSS